LTPDFERGAHAWVWAHFSVSVRNNTATATTMNTKPIIIGRVTENGSGLPGIGELVYDASVDVVYKIIGWNGSDLISTHGPGCGNSVGVLLEYRGSASDTTESEWDAIESSNYGVVVDDDTDE